MTIQPQAEYIIAGDTIDVGLKVKCQGGSGEVVGERYRIVEQLLYPVAAGSGPQTVVCDGQTHSVAVTVAGFGSTPGRRRLRRT